MNCLVLGGGGFIGSHVCDRLLAAGHQVSVFEKEERNRENLLHIGTSVQWIEGDFSNPEDLRIAVRGQDIIFHLISTTLPKSSNDNPAYDVSSNVISTIHLLEAACAAGVKKVIFYSSGGTVYGVPSVVPIPEEHPTNPECSYGIHKLVIEKYLAFFYHLHGLDYTVIRVANPYGERQKPSGSQGAITVFLYKALRGEPIEIWGDGSIVRDYLHISDLSKAALSVMDVDVPGKILNIGSGNGCSLNEIIHAIELVTGLTLAVRYTAARAFDVPVSILDISRAREYLGWSPEVDLQTGIAKTVAYLRGVIEREGKRS
jgi:UDP-glucose 4-epimerase